MRGLVFSIDDAYVVPFKVLWRSLIRSNSIPKATRVFILHEDTLTERSVKEITRCISKDGFAASFVDATYKVPDDLPISKNDHVSKATFYRLFVASILPREISSAVYLDSDAIVIRSIRILFEMELTKPIAAVDHLSPEDGLRLWGDISGNYFQAGVLIIDLAAWRSFGYESVFANILSNNRSMIKWWDQCILNLAFKDNWQRLPVWFNVCAAVRNVIDAEIIESKGCYIHFDGSNKPWKTLSETPQSLRWYCAYEDTFGAPFDFTSIKQGLRKTIVINTKKAVARVVKKILRIS